MANELAAIATVPNGATMTVDMICAPHIITLSHPIGKAIPTAFRKHFPVGRKLPFSCRRFSSGDLTHSEYSSMAATAIVANAVPMAAPVTPRPAPGTVISAPSNETERVGKIRKKLKTTSNRHMKMFSMLGVYIFPLLRNIPLHRILSCRKGRDRANMRKYDEASCLMASSPPSQPGRGMLIAQPTAATMTLNIRTMVNDCLSTFRALTVSFEPRRWET